MAFTSRPLFLLILTLALSLVVACSGGTGAPATPTTSAQGNAPVVVINSPASNASFENGATVTIQSTSSASGGVVLVELIVDGRLVQTSPTPNGQPQAQFSVIQTWQATAGQHTITVRATNSSGTTGDASILVNVTGAPANPTAVPPPTGVIPTAVRPTAVPPTAPPATCTLNSTFAGDVTIPDNTPIAPGGQFVKTWAIQNTGTCAWDAGYNLVFLNGSSLGAGSPATIPPVQPGQTVNISLNMVAPTTPGRYVSVWQIRASNGALFGTKMDAVIVVPGAPTPIPPTQTPIPSPCNGVPQITSFTASPSTIARGQSTTLSWGQVLNATSAVLSTPDGNSGVGTPGSITISPRRTTTYTLLAYCFNNVAQAQVTVTVQGAPEPTPPPPSQANQIRSIQVESQGNKHKVTIQYYWNGEDAPARIEAVGVNASSDPMTNRGQAAVIAGFVKFVIINLSGKNVSSIDVCMIGASGTELACSQKAIQ